MILQGKAKEDFEKWFYDTQDRTKFTGDLSFFNTMPFSMQYGVYVDWFREVLTSKEFLDLLQSVYDNQRLTTDELSEARQKAIEKANELYNKQ